MLFPLTIYRTVQAAGEIVNTGQTGFHKTSEFGTEADSPQECFLRLNVY